MKLNKEDIYINLQGKSEDELTELEQITGLSNLDYWNYIHFETYYNYNGWVPYDCLTTVKNKQEVTIKQLKRILQPMEGFTPIAMKCNQKQFEAIKPKLKVCIILGIKNFKDYCYIVNNHNGENKIISNASELQKNNFGRIIYEEWNEEIFLKACGIEFETLEQQLEKAKAEVKRIEKEIEDSKIKVGDWVIRTDEVIFKVDKSGLNWANKYCKKITDQELINKLNNLIK